MHVKCTTTTHKQNLEFRRIFWTRQVEGRMGRESLNIKFGFWSLDRLGGLGEIQSKLFLTLSGKQGGGWAWVGSTGGLGVVRVGCLFSDGTSNGKRVFQLKEVSVVLEPCWICQLKGERGYQWFTESGSSRCCVDWLEGARWKWGAPYVMLC